MLCAAPESDLMQCTPDASERCNGEKYNNQLPSTSSSKVWSEKNIGTLRYMLLFENTVSPWIGQASVPKKSPPIWYHTIGVYTITCAKNLTISRKSH